MKSLVLWALRGYKRWISPALPPSCRYVPTCSEYAAEAVERHGALRGSLMAAWRLLRCHPFAAGGLDPVVDDMAAEYIEPTLPQSARKDGAPRCPDTNRGASLRWAGPERSRRNGSAA